MTTAIDQRNAGLFSAAAYAPVDSITDIDTQQVINMGWRLATTTDGTPISVDGPPDSNTRLRVFVNDDTRQVVMAFKGSDSIADFKSDILNSGFDQYENIRIAANGALRQINETYAGYNVLVDGHSLGGGMAQSFALENRLNGFAQNSLPVASGTIDKYFTTNGIDINDTVSTYQAEHVFVSVNVSGDIATLKYSTVEHQLYISTETITLASPYVALELAGTATSPMGLALFGYASTKAHLLTTLNPLASEQVEAGDGAALPGSITDLLNNIDSITANKDGSYTLSATNGSVYNIKESMNGNNTSQVDIVGNVVTPTGEVSMMNTYDLTTGKRISTTRTIVDGETSTDITITPDGSMTKTVTDLKTNQVLSEEPVNVKPIDDGKAVHAVVGDVASFITSLRSGDEVTQIISAARLVYDIAAINKTQGLEALGNAAYGAGSVVGIISAIKGLQSDNVMTQIGSATSLLSSANTLYDVLDGGATYGTSNGFLESNSLQMLGKISAIISVANLATNLDDMLENGQYLQAISSTVSTYEAVAIAFFESGNYYLMAAAVAINLFGGLFGSSNEEPPPAAPVGEATFTRDANGNLSYQISNPLAGKEAYVDYGLGHNILLNMLNGPDGLLQKLNSQLQQANLTNTDPDRALTLIASRMPKITIQSWMIDSEADNGKDNYFYLLETKDPRTGQKQLNALANEDIVRHFAETLILPEAIVQQWEVNHLQAKFGSNEANWKTEGQWSTANSAIEQHRTELQATIDQAQQGLEAAKNMELTLTDGWQSSGMQGNVQQKSASAEDLAAANAAKATAIAQAQATLDNAQQAFDLYEVQHPSDPQLAARIVDESVLPHIDGNSSKEAIADYIVKRQVSMDTASQQWLKVIALDLSTQGDGISQSLLPNSVKQDLRSIQTDGVARFDVDNDGFREATQWISPTDAILGLDRDGNGRIDSANELFNGINTPFDQRGAASLKYYDDNNDGKLNAQDKVFKLLRLWMDLDGDGSAGDLEVFNMDMHMTGSGAAALLSAMDASGIAALEALAQQAVQAIDLATLKFQLKDGTTNQGSEVQLKSEVKGIALDVDSATQNISVIHENGLRENYITLVQDMSVLQDWANPNLTTARRDELKTLANKYGLNTDSADFMTVVQNLRVGGENMGGSGMPIYISSGDVFVDDHARQRIEAMRFSFQAVVDARDGDIANVAYLGTPTWVSTVKEQHGFNDGWNAAQGAVVVSDSATPADPNAPRPEYWVLPSDVYTLDYVVKGEQLGGLFVQKPVVVSKTNDLGQTVDQKSVSYYTTTQSVAHLANATLNGQEDQSFEFGTLQLEQEVRMLITGATPYTAVQLLGIREVKHGSIQIVGDSNSISPVIRFIADHDYNGTDAGFTYVVKVGDQLLDRTVNFDLAEVNDAPNVLGESIQAKEDVPLLIDAAALLANDTDPEGDTLSVIGIGRVGMGKAELLPNGKLYYTPPTDLYGTTDTLEYIVQDSRGATAIGVIKITLNAENDAPTVVSEEIRNVNEDTNVRIDTALLLANDFDPDFNFAVGSAQLRITAVGNGQHGQAFLDSTGHIIFTPDHDFNGTATFEYTVMDETGMSTTGVAKVIINAVNDAPRAFGETISSQEDQELVIDTGLLLLNEEDVDTPHDILNIIAVDEAVHGTVKLENGNVAFTPDANYNGEASFRYTVRDGAGGFAQSTVHIDVAVVNDAPLTVNRNFAAQEDTPFTITKAQLLAGITDVEDGVNGLQLTAVKNAQGGTLSQQGDSFTFTPEANKFGAAYFSYEVSDAQGVTSTSIVALDFNNVNDAPVFVAGSHFVKSGEEDQELRISGAELRKMFADPDTLAGDTLTLDVASLQAGNANDTIRFDANKDEVVFKAAPNANGVREFSLRVVDNAGVYSDTVKLSVDIRALNDKPIVNAVGFEMLEDGGYNDPTKQAWSYIHKDLLLKNASDVDGDALTVTGVSNGRTADGRAVNLSYSGDRVGVMAPLNYNGTITFNYTVSDGHGGTTTQTAYGKVTPVNDAPVIKALSSTIAFNWMLNYRLDIYDVDSTNYTTEIDRFPIQSVVHAYNEIAAHTNSLFTFVQNWRLLGSGARVLTDAEKYVGIQNMIYRGQTLDTSITFKVTDSLGATSSDTVSFREYRDDPVVIDLGNDGLEFLDTRESRVTVESSYAYDKNGDGLIDAADGGATETGTMKKAWVKPSEAILAWDWNGDNAINRDDEIEFGSHIKPNVSGITDLQSLAMPDFDANQDGKFDAADSRWKEFKLWQDLNGNGVSDPGELKTLEEAGIKALHLNANVLNRHYGADVLVRGYTHVEMADGSMLQAADVQLNVVPMEMLGIEPEMPTIGQQTATTASADVNKELFATQQQLQAAAQRMGSPDFTGGLQEQKVLTGQAYHYVLPEHLFPALGDGVQYAVTQASGMALPGWLHFDAVTRTLSGTPTAWQMGVLNLKVHGVDSHGASSAGVFSLSIAEFNQAPVEYGMVPAQYALEGELFTLEIAPNFFIDNDVGDKLYYSVTQVDGTALPDWLHFDAHTLHFFGTPTGTDVGALDLVMSVKDEANATAQSSFTLVIEAANDAPVLYNPVAVVQMRVGMDNAYTLPSDMFVDPDLGDKLVIDVAMANGEPLPSWLQFNSSTMTLSATPTQDQLAVPIQLQVVATDLSGAQSSTLVTVTAAMIGTESDDYLTGTLVSEELWGLGGNDTLIDNNGTDRLIGGAGNDTYVINSSNVIIENVNEGLDTVLSGVNYALSANVENLVLTGVAAINGTGNILNNTITGNAGDNTLDGGEGADTLIGGTGNDTYVVDDAGDVVTENTGEGTDTVQSYLANYTLAANVENLTLMGHSNTNGIGNELNNTIAGNAASNILNGSTGNDTLIGGAGDDVLDGAIPNDAILSLNLGSSVASYRNNTLLNKVIIANNVMPSAKAGQLLKVVGSGRADTEYVTPGSSVDFTRAGLGVDCIYLTGKLSDYQITRTLPTGQVSLLVLAFNRINGLSAGQTEVVYVASRANDEIYFADGYASTTMIASLFDTNQPIVLDPSKHTGIFDLSQLPFSEGADTLVGGTGNDTYVVDDAGDVVTENTGEGTDTVRSYLANHTLAANVENLILMGYSNTNGIGNELNNTITGNAANNILNGCTGNDILIGGAGDDVLDGAILNDVIRSFKGVSSVVNYRNGTLLSTVAIANNVLPSLKAGQTVVISGSSSVDTVYVTPGSSVDFVKGLSGVDRIYLTGKLSDYQIIKKVPGTLTFNRINGLSVDQTEVVTVAASTGGNNDEIYFVDGYASTYAMITNLNANLPVMLDSSKTTGIFDLSQLPFSEGSDTLIGGTGNDTYVVDDAGDVVTENTGEGTDTVQSYLANYTLAANVENLTLMGHSNTNGIGNELSNTITGNAANNILNGGAGADTMLGNLGDDSYHVDNMGDIVTESLNEGTDIVYSSISYTLGNNIENLYLDTTIAATLNGNELNNIIYGNAGNDILDGGVGNDTLNGGEGADQFNFSSPLSATNIDTISDFTPSTDRIGLSTIVFTTLLNDTDLSDKLVVGGADANALDANDYLIYNSTTKALYYDADGSGAGVAVQFATLNVNTVKASDFVVI